MSVKRNYTLFTWMRNGVFLLCIGCAAFSCATYKRSVDIKQQVVTTEFRGIGEIHEFVTTYDADGRPLATYEFSRNPNQVARMATNAAERVTGEVIRLIPVIGGAALKD